MNIWKVHLVWLALLLGQSLFAQEASEEILELQTKAYLALEQGKELVEEKQLDAALSAYQRALAIYRAIRQKDPNFKKDMLDWRVSLCGNEIARLTAEIQRAQPATPASQPANPNGLPPPPPFSPTPMNGGPAPRPQEPVVQPPVTPTPTPRPRPARTPEPAPRPNSPELQAEAADLEYMSKYIALLEEAKDLKKKMVAVQTREETTNLAILRQKKELETMTAKHDAMQKTIEKMTGRTTDLLDGLDESKADLATTTAAKEELETELERLKSNMTTAEEKLEVNEAKLRTLENEFQDNKKKITSNNRKVAKMETERDAETERANSLAVEVAKLKSDLAKQKEDSDARLASMEAQYASTESDQDKELKDTKKSLATARKRNTDMLDDYELAEAEIAALKATVDELQNTDTNQLAKLQAEFAELKGDYETNRTALAEKEAQLEEVDESLLRLEELETLYASAEKENGSLKAQITEQEERLTAVADGGGMEKQVKILLAEKADLSTQLDDLKDSHALMTVDLNGKTDALEVALSDREKALVRIKELQINIAKNRQEKGAVDSQLKQLETTLADAQVALNEAKKDAGGWLKDKAELEKMHAAVLADQEKSLQALRSDMRDAEDDIDGWKEKVALMETNLADTQKSLTEASKSAGSWLKEKSAIERSHASALAARDKSLESLREELQTARDDVDGWKEKLAVMETNLAVSQKSLAEATKSAGGWMKEKLAMERSHASALADQEKMIRSVRKDFSEAQSEISAWKLKSEDAALALKAEKKAMADLAKSSGSSGRTIAGLQESLAGLEDDLTKKEMELSKVKSVLAESARAIRTAKEEREKLAAALNTAASQKEKATSTLARERDEALKQLEAKEAEISELKKKGSTPSDQPMRRRSARMNDVVPVPVLEQLSQLSPLVNIRAKGETGFAVEYQGVGTIDLVLPE